MIRKLLVSSFFGGLTAALFVIVCNTTLYSTIYVFISFSGLHYFLNYVE